MVAEKILTAFTIDCTGKGLIGHIFSKNNGPTTNDAANSRYTVTFTESSGTGAYVTEFSVVHVLKFCVKEIEMDFFCPQNVL